MTPLKFRSLWDGITGQIVFPPKYNTNCLPPKYKIQIQPGLRFWPPEPRDVTVFGNRITAAVMSIQYAVTLEPSGSLIQCLVSLEEDGHGKTRKHTGRAPCKGKVETGVVLPRQLGWLEEQTGKKGSSPQSVWREPGPLGTLVLGSQPPEPWDQNG